MTATKKSQGSKKALNPVEHKPRRRKGSRYKSFQLSKRIAHPKGPLPTVRQLIEGSWRLLAENKRQVMWLTSVLLALQLVFVRGLEAPINFSELRDSFNELLGSESNFVSINLALVGTLFGTSMQAASETATFLQGLLILIFSLAFIWLFRQYSAGNVVTGKMALFRSATPFVPMVLVLMIVGLQLLPMLVGISLFSTVTSSGLASSSLETIIWLLLTISLSLLSIYMICSSIWALYVVTLPEMTPLRALRSARELVMNRRPAVFWRLLLLPVLLSVIMIGIMLPVLFFAPAIAGWLYFILSLLTLPVVHAYLYLMYRSLL